MATARLRLGQLLVDAGLISQDALDEVLSLQKSDGRRLGTLLVERGLINETQLTQILSHQLSVPWVSLLHIEFSRQLLNLVPRDVAEKYCMVPIYVRHVRGQGQTLYVAMDDPTNEEGLRECSAHAGLPVKAMIAPPSDIRNAIRVYYGVTPGVSSRPSMPNGIEGEEAPEAAFAPQETPPPPAVVSAPDAAAASEPPSVEVTEAVLSSGEIVGSTSAPQASVPTASAPQPSAPQAASPATPAQAETPAPHSAPHSAPPETLPDPGALSTAVAQAAERASGPVQIVEATPLPPPAERLRRVLEVVDETEHAPTAEDMPGSEPVDTIPEPRGRAPRMVSMTLLDGTTITLPAPRKKRRPETLAVAAGAVEAEDEPPSTVGEDERALTARDLITALKAICHGASSPEILGNGARWEALFGALLSVLLRKGLVADWEFVEELRKM